MADEQKRKLEIPWTTLLPMIAVLAGIVAQYKPLVSVRPAIPSEKSVGVAADQDVDARLWQDPLSVVQKERAALDADLQVKKVAADRVRRHQIEALSQRIRKSIRDTEKGHVLVLAVMLDSGPYLEQAESRLRTRQAVLAGLSESGYVPIDGEHIGFIVQEPWPLLGDSGPLLKAPDANADAALATEGGSLLFAWEQCTAVAASTDLTKPTAAQALPEVGAEVIERIIVLWLPGASFNSNPLGNFAELLMKLAKTPHDRLDFHVKLIGPANSTGLAAMLREVSDWEPNLSRNRALDGVSIFSARATASDDALWEEAQMLTPRANIEDAIDNAVPGGGLQFFRTVLPDDLLVGSLIDELELRQVHVAPWYNGRRWKNGDHVAVLTEWDNTYGRALARTFEQEAAADVPIGEDGKPVAHHQIDFFRYMHGIDGRLPGDASKDTKQDDSQKTSTEATEGLNQADYLRRLARRLKDEETRRENAGGSPLRAIGLLGNDIYDKLMILRALRPEFPGALFFTNNYDAHFELREEWDESHNLVIASPFTGTFLLDDKSRIPPFRDSNQTSAYAGTLFAMGKIVDLNEIVRQPHIFEVGRKGVHELVRPTAPNRTATLKTNPVPPAGLGPWLMGPRIIWYVLLAASALFLLACWIILSVVDRRRTDGGGWPDRLKRGCASTPFWLVFGIPVIVVAVLAIANGGDARLEPLVFASGISIWPSEMLRLLALLLAIHFLIKAWLDLRANQQTLTDGYHLAKLRPEIWSWKQIRMGLRRWHKVHGKWLKPGAQVTAKEAWRAYLLRNQFWPRVIRVSALSLIYGAFSFGLSRLFPEPLVPARGTTAAVAHWWILRAAVAGLIVLMFYVVDAIRLNTNFIRIVTGGVTKWEPELEMGSGRIPPLTREDLARYYDIEFVAERTEAVAPLIWYPLIVLALMVLARSAYFDNWSWPVSLVLIFTINALWAFGASIFLRRAAEQLRRTAVRSLEFLRVKSYNNPERRQMFEELIAEIRGLKRGAFAPLSEQPFVRAVILPSGGLGVLAVAQRLLNIF
jgi:hypothetical protein